MKCPKCDGNLVAGEIAMGGKGGYKAFWLPKSYYENSGFGIWLTKKAVERKGGMVIIGRNAFKEVSRSYGCQKCKIVITECK